MPTPALKPSASRKTKKGPKPLWPGMPATTPSFELATPSDGEIATSYLARFGDVLQLLCRGHRPPDAWMAEWLTNTDDSRLQDFVAVHGPAWAQGIGLLDAAQVAADQPGEGPAHETKEEWLAARASAQAEAAQR